MKYFLKIRPPVARSMVRHRFLHGIGMGPPLPGFRVRSHLLHIGIKIVPDILKIGKKQGSMTKNRIVANVTGTNGCEHLRPDSLVDALIFLNRLWLHLDDSTNTAHDI